MCFQRTQDRPNPLQELELRVRARGFSFMPCDVKMLDAEEMKLVKWRQKKRADGFKGVRRWRCWGEHIAKHGSEIKTWGKLYCACWLVGQLVVGGDDCVKFGSDGSQAMICPMILIQINRKISQKSQITVASASTNVDTPTKNMLSQNLEDWKTIRPFLFQYPFADFCLGTIVTPNDPNGFFWILQCASYTALDIYIVSHFNL